MKYLYKHFSKVYDLFNVNYDMLFQFIDAAIQKYAHNPQALLELACGTGNILQHFVGRYEISGLDISAPMLEKAKQKLPNVPFYEMSMADFKLDRKYDIIICMFDSINHLPDFENWVSTFRCVRNHLNSRGIFIFDMNTMERLERLAQAPGTVQQEGDTYLIMKATKVADDSMNWNTKIFKKLRDNLYEFSEDNIKETSFSQERVKENLDTLFSKVQISDNTRGRIFFICQV